MKKLFITFALCLLGYTCALAQEDWANFGMYRPANEQVTTAPKAVLMGDSITELWLGTHPDFFTRHNFAGRGISGQCTAQMLVRFRRDVIDLHPKYVVILGGINDIAQNRGAALEVENIFGNIVSMCELAKANKIKPILCTTTPANKIPWRPEMTGVNEKVLQLNEMIREYAKKMKYPLIEYYNNLALEDGGFPEEFSYDGIHPTAKGYDQMEKIFLQVLK